MHDDEQEQKKDVGAYESHGGRSDLGPAAPSPASHAEGWSDRDIIEKLRRRIDEGARRHSQQFVYGYESALADIVHQWDIRKRQVGCASVTNERSESSGSLQSEAPKSDSSPHLSSSPKAGGER